MTPLSVFFLLTVFSTQLGASQAEKPATPGTTTAVKSDNAKKQAAETKASQDTAPTPKLTGGVSGVVAPGSTLTLPVSGLTTPSVTIHSLANPSLDAKLPPITGEASATDLKIVVPAKLDAGPYYFKASDDGQIVIPGSIDIEPDSIKLLSISPATAYRGQTNKFDFDIVGENFSLVPKNDDVTIEGQGSIVENRGADEKACRGQNACLWVSNPRLMHIVGYRPKTTQGIVNVGVVVGNVVAADTKQLVLARLSGTVVFILTAVVTGLLFLLVRYVVFSGVANKRVGRKRLTLLQAFILDPQTNSYSLSKFQLLSFSATFIFGYLYVLLSRWLVQWQFTLPDVPNTIAGLLGISGGATIASAGLTAARGSKGAGLQQPTGADLISTGGVVVPERFQFFVWTIVACGGFLALLMGQDPAKLNSFPDLPSGLLYVMGVSAAGYLGGKAARKPGPVLELIAPEKGDDKTPPTLTVQGQNLDSCGRFFVDNKELGIASDEDRKKFADAPAKLMEASAQVGAPDTSFSTRLKIAVVNSTIDLTGGDHAFRIVNRDGQFADLSFSVTPPMIQSVYQQDKDKPVADPKATIKQLPESTTAIDVVIQGSGLISGSQISWKAQGDDTFRAQTSAPSDAGDGKTLMVNLVPGTAGTGTILVTTPSGFVTNANVQVVPLLGGKAESKPAAVTTPAAQSTPVATQSAAAQTAPTAAQPTGAEAAPAPASGQGATAPDPSAAAPNNPGPKQDT